MASEYRLDEELARRLPLPLAQLYRRAHNAHGAHNRHQAAYFLWEAALKLLGSTALAEYAALGRTDPALADRLGNLSRPAVGHWWEFVRLLVPVLAGAAVPGYLAVREQLLGGSRDDLPRAAGLDAALREALDGTAGARSTVRLGELFDRLVRYRNRELGHGAMGLRPADFYERMGGALLAGLGELLGRLDALGGRRLVYVGELRQSGGVWQADRFELTGEVARAIDPLELPHEQAASLPDGDRLYLEGPEPGGAAALRPLYPLLLYEAEAAEVFFLNARRGRQRTEYLSYTTGRTLERQDAAGAQRSPLARLVEGSAHEPQAEPGGAPAAEAEGGAPAAAPRRRLGEFELFSELGRGGMGVVYRALQPALGRHVALKKLLRPGDARSEARFRREIRALGKVEHPNLVKVFTSGSDGEDWFYAMELVEGADLAGICDRLSGGAASTLGEADWRRAVTTACEDARKKEKPLGQSGEPTPPPRAHPAPEPPLPDRGGQEYVERVAEIIRQVAGAAHALHEAGVVHRDVKPGNILVTPDGTHAVLTDLGLAQLADELDGRLTRTREFVGTLRYASPEQVLAAGPVDRRSDVYSLGATLWELLTLRPLYAAGEETSPPELMRRIQYEQPEPVRRHNPRVPPDLEAVVLKCLEKDARRRYATARELADDLQRFLNRQPVRARSAGPVRRALRRLPRPPRWVAVLLAVLLLPTLALLGYLYWHTHHAVPGDGVEYYADFTTRWGAPEGIGRLTEDETRRRNRSWRLLRHGGQVEQVEAVNGTGHPSAEPSLAAFLARPDEEPRECGYSFERNERGEVIGQSARDATGKVLWVFHYSTRTMGHYADEKGFPRVRARTGEIFVEIIYTNEGLIREIHYLDNEGKPQANAAGVFGVRHEYDDRGRAVVDRFLGADGNPAPGNGGYACAAAVYDVRGNRVETSYRDAEERPVRHGDGYARWTARFDDVGNEVERTYRDEEGRPTATRDGYAGWAARYDGHGNQVELTFLDVGGRPARARSGVARVTAAYDERGKRTEVAYLDEDGRPVRTVDQGAPRGATEGEGGSQVKETPTDPESQAPRPSRGYAQMVATYDKRGNEVERAYFDEEGRPTVAKEGYFKRTAHYDERGNEVEEAYSDVQGRPARGKDGYARWTAGYDERGKRVGQTYFDEAGQLARTSDGYSSWEKSYDKWGRPADAVYRGFDGSEGFAAYAEKYDAQGRPVEKTYLDDRGRPTRHRDGNAQVKARYDERGNLIEATYFDEAGRPIRVRDGYTRMARTYDDRGNRVEEAYFDETGRPVTVRDGYARWTGKYDEHGYLVETTYYGPDGRPAQSSGGYSRWTAKYDEQGNRTGLSFFDGKDQPVRSQDGYARWTAHYDSGHQLIERHFYDADGTQLASRVVITSVSAGGQGEHIGLKAGDVVLSYDGVRYADTEMLVGAIRQGTGEESPKELTVLRGDKEMTFHAPPGLLGVHLVTRCFPGEKRGNSPPGNKD
jgi:YD repeat-containing protein